MSDLERMTFGPPDANYDADLLKYFVRNNVYRAIQQRSALIVIGKKGAGKTALFTKFSHDAAHSGDLVLALKFEDTYKPSEKVAQSYSELSKNLQYEFLLELARKIVLDRTGQYPEDAKQLLKSTLSDYAGKVKRFLSEIESVETPFFSLTRGQLRSSGAFFEKRLVDSFRPALTDCLKTKKAWILVDDPDTIFTNPDDIDYPIIEGLLFAVTELAHTYKGLIRPIVFVKTFVYDYLDYHFADIDRIKDKALAIVWQDAELSQLVADRIRFRLGGGDGESWKQWQRLFEAASADEIKSIQSFLFERLVNGPRDLVYFCDFARDAAIEEGASKITTTHLREAEPRFSAELLKMISREYSKPRYYEGIDSFIRDTFTRKRGAYDRQDLEKILEDSWRTNKRRYESFPWFNFAATGDSLVEILYRIGFIGYRHSSGSVIFSWQRQDEAEYRRAERFEIHRGYRSALSITDAGGRKYTEAETGRAKHVAPRKI